jgi:dihydrofolate reductase
MKKTGKIITYIATSADGYIARSDGTLDWLPQPRKGEDYGWTAFYNSVDLIVLGRRTYDASLRLGAHFNTKMPHVVFSHNPSKLDAAPGVRFVRDVTPEAVGDLRATAKKNIFLMGGAELIASFLDAGAIDEFDIHVIPTFIGDGIHLIAPRHRDVPLKLLASNKYSDGVVRLNYSVSNRNRR